MSKSVYLLATLLQSGLVWAGNTEDVDPAQDKSTETVTVTGRRIQQQTEPSETTQKLLDIAGNAGDPLSAVYAFPGVVYAGGDAGGAPAIRGSSPDDNAFYIDGMPAGYIFHLFGDSIFNENLIAEFTLLPAAFGGEYGNATGGIIDVALRDPKQQPWSATVDASFLKAGFLVEGQTGHDQSAFMSYRRSLIQFFVDEDDELDDDVRVLQAPESDDYQGKYQWLIGDRHKFSFSVSGARDFGALSIAETSTIGRADPDSIGDLTFEQRFDSQALRWDFYGDKLTEATVSLNHLLNTLQYNYGDGQYVTIDDERNIWRSSVAFSPGKRHLLRFGQDVEQRDFIYSFDVIPYFCTDHQADCEGNKGERIQDDATSTVDQYALYLTDQWRVADNWTSEIGVRTEYNKLTEQRLTHPRVSLTWAATDEWSITAKAGSYSRMPDAEKVLPVLGNPALHVPTAKHFALATRYQLVGDWQTSFELYEKHLDDLPRAIEPDLDTDQLHYTNDVSGEAKGIEWVIEKEKTDKWYGWFSLSWSRSERTDKLTDVTTEYYLDTPLIANAVFNYTFNDRWSAGARLTVRSGARYTPIIGIHPNPDYPDHYQPTYGELNSKTLPTYYRLDVQGQYDLRFFGHDAALTFGVINATNAENVSGYYFEPDGNETPDNFSIAKEVGMPAFAYVGFKVHF